MTAIEDQETDVEGEQAHAMFIAKASVQTDSKEHQNRIVRNTAANVVVTLPATPEEGREATKALTFAMKVCHEQSS